LQNLISTYTVAVHIQPLERASEQIKNGVFSMWTYHKKTL